MCNYCSTIDEAHYKRHHELVVQLRSIYESCGEVDWTIVPAEPGDPRRGRPVDPSSGDSESDNGSLTPEETPVSKRGRKDAKCLVRAASRARVVTQEEIKYVDSVLHTAEGISSNDRADPANLEDLQLIEAHLRYNANVYNHHASRHDLRKFAMIPDFDVDFDAEMERVLYTFRITELAKRNLKDRGLQGKELKEFDISVEAFRTAAVEDLVLVKKDTMEIRMRRAGYLRYTSKTAYQIVEDRYSDKDWKTGERIASSSSDSSSLTSPADELVTLPTEASNTVSMPAVHSTHDADRRHLEHIHVRISGNDGLRQTVIEPYHTPLLPMTPNTAIKRPAILQLKVTQNKENKAPAEAMSTDRLRHGMAWQTVPRRSLYASEKKCLPLPPPSTRPRSSNEPGIVAKPLQTSDPPPTVKSGPVAKHLSSDEYALSTWKPNMDVFKLASTNSDAPAVQAPIDEGAVSLKGPDRTLTLQNGTEDAHPVVSQKKAKKMQREARRKAKKMSDLETTSSPTASAGVDGEEYPQALYEMSSSASKVDESSDAADQTTAHTRAPELKAHTNNDKIEPNLPNIVVVPAKDDMLEISAGTTAPVVIYTTYGKHDHWTRFARVFIVDQLTAPLLQSFEIYCPCVDPMNNLCSLVYPDKHTLSAGPYNRAQGERMMSMYEQHDRTKGRVMLMDDDIATYFVGKTILNGKLNYASMPTRLLREHTEFQEGHERGPLMKQELAFYRMYLKNIAMSHPLTMRTLQGMQYQEVDYKGSSKLRYCYCYTEIHKQEPKEGLVECSFRDCEFGGAFHKRCVKKLGVEKVSRWYCTACEKQMKIVAHEVLNTHGVDDVAVIGRTERTAGMTDKAGSVVGPLKSRLQHLYTRKTGDELAVEDVD
ncbi:zinc ion binding [Ascochyta rabiei]|uniref:Zinc ion binding n=1 Tax=Didymella rabiei TaxID=5454 RepID=A0A163EUA3_DIDRA|nr:zinc ion binding [Ascochyta rabiei]